MISTKIAKYTLLPFICVMLYAAVMGKEGLKQYSFGEPGSLLEEWVFTVSVFIMYDAFKYLANMRQ